MLRGSSAARKNYGAPVEKLCWSCLSPTLNLFHPPCPLRLKLLGSSMALLLQKLLMLPFSGRRWTRLLRLFWPVSFFFLFPFLFCLFQTCHLPLPSVSSDLFPSLYYLELCQVPYPPFCISISSFRPSLIRSDEALWRNVIFSIKNFEKSKHRSWSVLILHSRSFPRRDSSPETTLSEDLWLPPDGWETNKTCHVDCLVLKLLTRIVWVHRCAESIVFWSWWSDHFSQINQHDGRVTSWCGENDRRENYASSWNPGTLSESWPSLHLDHWHVYTVWNLSVGIHIHLARCLT